MHRTLSAIESGADLLLSGLTKFDVGERNTALVDLVDFSSNGGHRIKQAPEFESGHQALPGEYRQLAI